MERFRQSERVKAVAAAIGFDLCGIAAVGPIPRTEYLKRWLESGHAGTMSYLQRDISSRVDPRAALPGARSLIAVGVSYRQPHVPATGTGAGLGKVAMYAWGEDYHGVLRGKMEGLVQRLRAELAGPFESRICVDTSPILERELAARAGIGWIGKNTLVLNPAGGSYFFLGIILTTLDLAPDDPMADHCGTCTACLDACPTRAFPAPYQMDASRCISYLTIEHRGEIPADLQPAMGDWLFGCDVCQEVCPHNRDAPPSREPAFTPRPGIPEPCLGDVLAWSPSDYARVLRGSAMKRAKREVLQRNARIVLNNQSKRGQESRHHVSRRSEEDCAVRIDRESDSARRPPVGPRDIRDCADDA